jgi:hypothetical protein
MKREFVMTELFDSSWKKLKLTDNDLFLLQDELLRNTKCGEVMRGTGGFRKTRFALSGHGKSGSLRVIYLDIPDFDMLYLMLAYPKSEKDSLRNEERNELKKLSLNIKNYLHSRKGKGAGND